MILLCFAYDRLTSFIQEINLDLADARQNYVRETQTTIFTIGGTICDYLYYNATAFNTFCDSIVLCMTIQILCIYNSCTYRPSVSWSLTVAIF